MADFWNPLNREEQLALIVQESYQLPVLIFKHSTRCSISDAALSRVERNWQEAYTEKMKPYYLDLIAFRSVSNAAASVFGVEHQSPQVLLISGGKCIYHASHFEIHTDALLKALS